MECKESRIENRDLDSEFEFEKIYNLQQNDVTVYNRVSAQWSFSKEDIFTPFPIKCYRFQIPYVFEVFYHGYHLLTQHIFSPFATWPLILLVSESEISVNLYIIMIRIVLLSVVCVMIAVVLNFTYNFYNIKRYTKKEWYKQTNQKL